MRIAQKPPLPGSASPPPLGVLGLALLVLASPAVAARNPNELSLGATFSNYISSPRTTYGHLLAELAYERPGGDNGLLGALVFGGGLRSGPVPIQERQVVRTPLEGFVRVRLRARLGIWEAMAGPEIGLSGFARLASLPRPIPEPGAADIEQARLSPLYFAIAISPAQLRLGRVLVSALELHVGPSGRPLHSALRYQVGLLRLGFTL